MPEASGRQMIFGECRSRSSRLFSAVSSMSINPSHIARYSARLGIARRLAAFPRQIPVQQQPRFHAHGRTVEIGNVVDMVGGNGDIARNRQLVQLRETFDAGAVALGNRPARGVQNAVRSEILDQQDAGVVIDLVDVRRGESGFMKRGGDGDEGIGVLRQMRNLGVGLAIEHRRPFRLARPIHQDHALAAISRIDRFIGAQRGIAGEKAPLGTGMIMAVEENP